MLKFFYFYCNYNNYNKSVSKLLEKKLFFLKILFTKSFFFFCYIIFLNKDFKYIISRTSLLIIEGIDIRKEYKAKRRLR